MTIENDLRNGTVSFYTSVKGFYKNGMNEKDFYSSLSNGQGFNNQSLEAKNLLSATFKLLSLNATENQVQKDLYKTFTLFTYEGIKLMNIGKAENLDEASTILFGVKNEMQETKLSNDGKGPNGELMFTNATECKWYQIGCHVRWLFGTDEGRKVLKAVLDVLTLIVSLF